MHAISPVCSQERSRGVQLQHAYDLMQAELTQLRVERARLKQQLAQALEQIAELRSHAAPVPTGFAESSPEQSLSRVVVSTYPGGQSSSAESRHVERLGCEFDIEFLDDTHLFSGLTQDISQGGLFVATYQSLPLGSVISLTLELPGSRLEVQGEVRWARAECEALEQRPGFGVAFRQLSPEALAALTEFCRSRPPHYYDS